MEQSVFSVCTEEYDKYDNQFRKQKGECEMSYEKSCGAIVYKVMDGKRYYLLVKQKEGFWAFPKGHIEDGETEEECAFREVKEETGLSLTIFEKGFCEIDKHPIPGTKRIKIIKYFLSEICKEDHAYYDKLTYDKDELCDARFVTLKEANKLITWESRLALLKKADQFAVEVQRDKEFCRGADRSLLQLKRMAIHEGMTEENLGFSCDPFCIVLTRDNLVVCLINYRHNICISIMFRDDDHIRHETELIDLYQEIAGEYSSKGIQYTFGESFCSILDHPGLSVDIPYFDTIPDPEYIKKEMDALIRLLKEKDPL